MSRTLAAVLAAVTLAAAPAAFAAPPAAAPSTPAATEQAKPADAGKTHVMKSKKRHTGEKHAKAAPAKTEGTKAPEPKKS
ncbi:MAG: hypothetical protein KJS97_07265 [Alphaproteobacteria bacterium]|nr:hypothetical protein [Alphaproteobacteria bacterium]